MNKSWSLLCSLGCCTLSNFWFSNSASAQISADGTTSTTVNEDGSGNFTIDQGDRAGNNLFHSFGDFSVPTNGSAFFNNATDISNIFSRVTGGNISNIDGLIGANGSANLFLVNPAGILFGNNARLDIGGSFLGTTADSILFEDGLFSATDLDNPPLLTINAPIGLNFRDNPGDIVNTSVGQNPNGETNITGGAVGLQVPNGETLALVGGNVLLDDGNLSAKGGHIEISSVFGEGEVGITETDTGFSFNYDSINSFGDITLQNTAVVDVNSSNGGSINVNANNLTISDSSLNSGIASGLGTPNSQAGDIVLNATNSVTLDDGNITNDVNFDAIGNSGEIEIITGSLTVLNASQITSQVDGTGNSGDININAQGTVSFDGRDETDSFPSAIFTSIEPSGEGNGGNININAESLEITNRAQLLSNVEGIGDAGDINIEVTDEVRLVNSDLISEVSEPDENGEGGRGNGGDINITTGSLLLQDGSALLADTENIGDAGNINVEARDRLVLEGEGFSAFTNSTNLVFSQISTTSESSVSGKSGNIDISANELSVSEGFITSSTFSSENAGNITVSGNNLSLTNGGQINSFTNGSGNAGNIVLNVSDTVIFDGQNRDGFSSGLFATVGENATGGSGGSIILGSEQSPIEQLNLTNGALISVSTFGQGNAGNLTIFTEQLMLKSGGELQATSFGNGNAGNLTVNAFESIKISGTAVDGSFPTGIFASAFDGTGNGGNLTIATDQLIVQDQGTIAVGNFQIVFGDRIALPSGTGVAGNLDIAAKSIEVDNGTITARNAIGIGGEIAISAESLLLKNGALIEASTTSEEGKGGSLNFEVSDNIFLRNESLISVESVNSAIAGDIKIDTNFIVAFPNSTPGNGSDIIANATEGDGGNINITAESLLGIEERTANPGNETNDIDASSDFGLDGTISIFTPDTTVIQGTTEIPNNIITPEQSLAQACSNNRNTSVASSFTIKGKGGVPPLPDAPMGSEIITVNGEVANNSNNSYAIPTSYGYIIPARGAIKTADGKIILTATPVSGSASRDAAGSLHCGS